MGKIILEIEEKDLISYLQERSIEDFIECIANPTEDFFVALIEKYPRKFCYIPTENQTERICLEAVKRKGYMLEYVKNQTEEICLEAVKQDGYALEYVENQTKEICLEAVKQDGNALEFVTDQTEEICLEAVKQNKKAIEYVENKFTYLF